MVRRTTRKYARRKYCFYKFRCAANTSLKAARRYKTAKDISEEVSGDRSLILITRSLLLAPPPRSPPYLVALSVPSQSAFLFVANLGTRTLCRSESLFRQWYYYPVKVPPVIRMPPRFSRGFFLFFSPPFDRLSYFHVANATRCKTPLSTGKRSMFLFLNYLTVSTKCEVSQCDPYFFILPFSVPTVCTGISTFVIYARLFHIF